MRGDLGPLTVWTTPDTIRDKHESQEEWKLLYSGERPPSPSPALALTLALALAYRYGAFAYGAFVPGLGFAS